ncbi:MAG TPA: peptidoglycan editing factor PgeF [Bacteroidota bacterium]|nr:peptidoglycan editing factor PgeF [Bacteroidota bacterium]
MEIIRAKLFEPYRSLVSGMSTRNGGVSIDPYGLNMSVNVGDNPEHVRENRSLFFTELKIGIEQMAFPLQHHTATVRIADHPGTYEFCDALITKMPNVFIGITVADCVPILMYDPTTQTVGGIHAGWRGTASKIVKKTIAKLLVQCEVKPSNLRVFIGPAAGRCCYEVGSEVAGQFPESVVDRKEDGRAMLDVKEANRIQLLECGVPDAQIEVSPLCTITERGLFHSYRREGEHSGRMMAVIGRLREPGTV